MTLDWGTVPAFLSFAVALWALVEARGARRWQRRDELQDQAKRILVPPQITSDGSPGSIRVEISVENLSDYPITDVWLSSMSQLIDPSVHMFEHAKRINPGEALRLDQIVAAKPDPYPISGDDRLRVDASFTDHNGYKWQRRATGEIKPPINARSRSRPVRLLWRILPNAMVHRWLSRDNRPPIRQRLPPRE